MAAGRFAPTPSGPLHAGSLIAAVASRCDALSRGGLWQLRIDDIDPPRERAGAIESILATLARHGLRHDGPIRRQSERLERYRDALRTLAAGDHLFRCRCTRRALRGEPLYPGTCRGRGLAPDEDGRLVARPRAEPGDALRMRLAGRTRIDDRVQGALEAEAGDTILRRRDGLVAYPLASAVDDADIERVVRGADLLEASAAQIEVLERLGHRPPAWAHVPVAVDERGEKLGKSTGAAPLDALEPLPTLLGAWAFLGQAPLAVADLEAFWREAPGRWSLARVPRERTRPSPVIGA